MARRRADADGGLIVLLVVGAAMYVVFLIAAWLLRYWWIVVSVVAVGLAFWLYVRHRKNQQIVAAAQHLAERPLSNPEKKAAVILGRHQYTPRAPAGSLNDIAAAVANGDWNTARRWLQRIAYQMVGAGVTPGEKAQFTEIMKTFASGDPAYRKLLDRALPTIRDQPGVMQSQFTKGLSGEEVEIVRYMFYFAHELGDIVRVKKGSSYQLYAPGDYDPSRTVPATKPKRRTRVKNVDA